MASRVTRSKRQPPEQQEQQSRARWTSFLTNVLADLLVEQVHKGNRPNNSFSKKAWRQMCEEFYKKTCLKWDKEQLKNRYSVLRRQHSILKSLMDRSDFSWDESTGAVIANDEVWDEYIKEHPDAETIKASGCPIYKQLCTIFTEQLINGKHDLLAEIEPYVPCTYPLAEHLNTTQPESSSQTDEVEDMADNQETVQPVIASPTGNRKRGRKGIDDAIAGAILEMASASKLRTAAMKKLNGRYSIADCIRELDCVKDLDGIQSVDEHVYFTALDLFNNPNARETFLSLKHNKRLAWLHWKCSVGANTP